MAAALVYQALERSTGSVGLESVICPEKHEGNKSVVLELARQLTLLGVDPLLALEPGTFAPGDVSYAHIS